MPSYRLTVRPVVGDTITLGPSTRRSFAASLYCAEDSDQRTDAAIDGSAVFGAIFPGH
ncbi:hypothetical protein GBAR_LOCUS14124 [Geodia barretti]|uniref:Uncharacterized protein n=1 Tax=Geodia barretti TaxID=519541 RepID=A0AA35S8Y1_GEOBA|nr:hypothetical protein GBAR_LOCUS14124 [Geodia barretti]